MLAELAQALDGGMPVRREDLPWSVWVALGEMRRKQRGVF